MGLWNGRRRSPPTKGTLVFKATLKLGEIHDVGKVQYGHRRVLDVTGGTVTGDKVSGTVLTGGLDLPLELSNGSIELEQINIIRTSDNALIFMRTCGFAPAGDSVTRIVPDLEVAQLQLTLLAEHRQVRRHADRR